MAKPKNLDPDHVQKLEMLTSDEAAVYLRSSPSTLAKYRCYGGGPEFIQVSARKVLYARTALDAWLTNRSRTNTWKGAA
ncbi:helix-turn-helix domain-containing protein [Paenochrobactrum glaciei]|uniref:Helix-turn-helix domain-containing protein n=1 Tax=Paenochrobactrum glaciei TaxID=486407 RepID=A0ABN1GBE0_9HYPH